MDGKYLSNDPLPVLPGYEQDLGHKNIINTSLFYQVCKVHDRSVLEMQRSHDTLASDIST